MYNERDTRLKHPFLSSRRSDGTFRGQCFGDLHSDILGDIWKLNLPMLSINLINWSSKFVINQTHPLNNWQLLFHGWPGTMNEEIAQITGKPNPRDCNKALDSNETGNVEINIQDALVLSFDMPSAKKIIDIAARHETGHELLAGENAIRDNFFNNNNDSIMTWLASAPEYSDLANNYIIVTNAAQQNPELAAEALELQRIVTEEFINNTGESDIKLTSPVQLAVLQFARDLGFNVSSETNARLLLKDLIAGNIDKLRAQAEPVEATSQYAGGMVSPGVAPEMEGVLREAEADAAPTGTYVTPQASEAFDDFNPEQALEEDIAQEQRVPQTCR